MSVPGSIHLCYIAIDLDNRVSRILRIINRIWFNKKIKTELKTIAADIKVAASMVRHIDNQQQSKKIEPGKLSIDVQMRFNILKTEVENIDMMSKHQKKILTAMDELKDAILRDLEKL